MSNELYVIIDKPIKISDVIESIISYLNISHIDTTVRIVAHGMRYKLNIYDDLSLTISKGNMRKYILGRTEYC